MHIFMWRCGPPSRGGREVSQGEKGSPEAPLGPVVVESRDESGQTESRDTLRPSKPYSYVGFGEGALCERVAERVDLACRSGADRHEGVRFGGEDLLREQARGGVGHVGLWEPHGLQAAVQGLQDSGSDRLLDEKHDPGGVIAERGRVASLLHKPGQVGNLVRDLHTIVAHCIPRPTEGALLAPLICGSHDGRGGGAGRWL
jgi:hypothetical protein